MHRIPGHFAGPARPIRAGLITLILLLLAVGFAPAVKAESLSLGRDLPYRFIEAPDNGMSPEEALEALQNRLWHHRIFSAGYTESTYWLYFTVPRATFEGGDQWLRVAPNYLDQVTLYFREAGAGSSWTVRETGDLTTPPRGDLDYRFPVFVLPEPSGAPGYEVLVRMQSSSAMLLNATLWKPEAFTNAAVRADGFWGGYFGLAAIGTILALYLALLYRARLLWAVLSFSVSYLVVACVQGYIDWLSPWPGLPIQHYLTGTSIMLSYPALIWMAAEAIGLREHLPQVYRMVMTAAVVLLIPLVSIPLDRYGLGLTIQALGYLTVALTLLGSAGYVLWRERFKVSTLLLAISPFAIMAVSSIAISSTFGLVGFSADLYLTWQYMLLINAFLVIGIALVRILNQRQEQQQSKRLALELKVEQEARFHQRQFMGMVSHEFRTPLAVLSATLQNLRFGGMDQAAMEARYGKMERAIDRLTQLSDNCLADARLSAESLRPEYQLTELHPVVLSAATIASLSERHQLKVVVDGSEVTDPAMPGPRVRVDAALLRIALANVMDNAVKYSSGGEVRVDCQTENSTLVVSVTDQGPGIPSGQAEQIFERYHQGEFQGASRGGVGLGLFVARQIAEAHGGTLRLAENRADGCRFEFVLPAAAYSTWAVLET